MSKHIVQVFYGPGKGKTSAAVGQCIRSASMGNSTIIIQFLKGSDAEEFGILKQLEPDVKLFRFDRTVENYCDLDEDQKKEERQNLINGFNFAKKVMETGECDVLILDEVLGLVQLGIISIEDIINVINSKADFERLVLTGYDLPEELVPYTDIISKIELKKDLT